MTVLFVHDLLRIFFLAEDIDKILLYRIALDAVSREVLVMHYPVGRVYHLSRTSRVSVQVVHRVRRAEYARIIDYDLYIVAIEEIYLLDLAASEAVYPERISCAQPLEF